MYQVVVASSNPAKFKAVSDVCQQIFTDQSSQVTGLQVPSHVRAQPLSDDETKLGTLNRLKNLRELTPNAHYRVAIEAGIEGDQAFAWIGVENQDLVLQMVRSASFQLPRAWLSRLQQGEELGQVLVELTGIANIKHQGGAISVITGGHLTRDSVYQQAILLALYPLHAKFLK
jgi:inosine/xanthosine triphosphatase